MLIQLPNAKTPQDAIAQGQEYFKNASLVNPTLVMNQGVSVCDYTSDDNGTPGIWVTNPPHHLIHHY
jgi:hypothetical protein